MPALSVLISTSILTLTLLSLHLTTVSAAPPAQPPPPLRRPNINDPITCYATPGPGLIALNDCIQALAQAPFVSPADRAAALARQPFTRPQAPSAPPWTREPNTGPYALPQSFEHGTCSVFVDLPSGVRSAVASWAEVQGWMRELVDRCAGRENGLAGKSRRGAVTVTLFKRGVVGGLRGSLGPEAARLMDRLTGTTGGGARLPTLEA